VLSAAIASPFLTNWQAKRVARRLATGGVDTSQAGELWEMTKAMIASLQAENAKLIEQRDKLVASFDRMLPVQQANSEMLADILNLLEGGASANQSAAAPAPPS